jgi:hypothetical protein
MKEKVSLEEAFRLLSVKVKVKMGYYTKNNLIEELEKDLDG